MKKILLFSLIGLAGALTAFAPSSRTKESTLLTSGQSPKYTLDKAHTSLKFSVSHLVISDVDGNFKSFDGTLESSKPDFSDAKISFTVDVNSINTDNEKRDGHLKSDDFFNAEKYPDLKFVGNSLTHAGDDHWILQGEPDDS
jgi:polyisoprenoid-binding protein YceI